MYAKNPSEFSQTYYTDNKESRCAYRRARYALAEPECEVQEQYVKEILGHLLINSEARVQLIAAFRKQQTMGMPISIMSKTACRVVAKRLLNKSLQTHKEHVGSLLKACRLIKAYRLVKAVILLTQSLTTVIQPTSWIGETTALPIDENGKCIVAKKILSENEKKKTGNTP